MPLGAVVGRKEIWDEIFSMNPLAHTSTFGGNSLACAAGYTAINIFQRDKLAEASTVRGEQMLAGLCKIHKALPGAVKEVRGQGLMIGIEFFVKDVAEMTINALTRRSVLAAYTLNNPNVIRIEPPLIITSEQVETALIAIEESIAEAVSFLEGM